MTRECVSQEVKRVGVEKKRDRDPCFPLIIRGRGVTVIMRLYVPIFLHYDER